mmetsp:Transcript_11763/g.24060  ORF Transcript_11763/g.24060 Transcript_11763/m.24060 type:complete len:250 (+) Transcript_11763:745-1494(+)
MRDACDTSSNTRNVALKEQLAHSLLHELAPVFQGLSVIPHAFHPGRFKDSCKNVRLDQIADALLEVDWSVLMVLLVLCHVSHEHALAEFLRINTGHLCDELVVEGQRGKLLEHHMPQPAIQFYLVQSVPSLQLEMTVDDFAYFALLYTMTKLNYDAWVPLRHVRDPGDDDFFNFVVFTQLFFHECVYVGVQHRAKLEAGVTLLSSLGCFDKLDARPWDGVGYEAKLWAKVVVMRVESLFINIFALLKFF